MTQTFIVSTEFGCICGERLDCVVCATGRRYVIEVDNKDRVQAVWTAMCQMNPLLVQKQIKPRLAHDRELLDLDRRIISYDFGANARLKATMPPSACFAKAMWTAPRESPPPSTEPAESPPVAESRQAAESLQAAESPHATTDRDEEKPLSR